MLTDEGHMQAVLSSWKEIAAYMGKGVRTVQRWERELGLPVRRPVNGDRRIVLATPAELDRWIREQSRTRTNGSLNEEITRLRSLVQAILEETMRAREGAERLGRNYAIAQEFRKNKFRRAM